MDLIVDAYLLAVYLRYINGHNFEIETLSEGKIFHGIQEYIPRACEQLKRLLMIKLQYYQITKLIWINVKPVYPCDALVLTVNSEFDGYICRVL